MSQEIYSLQSLADKIRDQQTAIDAKFAEQKPVIDNLTLVWRTAVMGVIGALILSFLAFSLPSIYKIGDMFAVYWSRPASPTRPALPTKSGPSSPEPPPTIPAQKQPNN